MQEEEEVDSGSDSGEMEAGLQMDTGAALPPPPPPLLLTAGSEVLEGGVNWPLAPLSELASLTGEPFFFIGLLTALFCTPLWVCWACWRCLARRFLNQTWKKEKKKKRFILIKLNSLYCPQA